jgi:hypothetical protein
MNNGGPAFPQPLIETRDGAFEHPQDENCGMSLRDYIAIQAMSGALGGVPGGHLSPENLARESYLHADAMLREREKQS